jgi:tripartite-type tricarboxylate transporter receptor subunit TctC
MRRRFLSLLAVSIAAAVLTVGCSQAAPAASPTQAPAAPAAAPTAAPKTAAPTTAPAAAPTAAPAQKTTAFPEKGKTVTVIVGANAGGSTDVGARLMAPGMEKALGVPVQVVNKPGAGWQVGLTELSMAKPDGYTVGYTIMPQTNTIYLDPERQAVFKRESFQPLGMQVVDPGVIAVKADSPYKTINDLVNAAKADPGKITASTTGILGDDHLALLRTEQAAGIKFATVHFDGGAPSITALLGGHVDVNFNNVGDYMAHVKSGAVRILAVLDAQESKYYPGVPTMEKATGIKLSSASSRGISMPVGAPKEVVDALAAAFKSAFEEPTHLAKLDEQALTSRYMGPADMAKLWAEWDSVLPALMEEVKKEAAAKK